jgi:ferredoxin-NADP reductase
VASLVLRVSSVRKATPSASIIRLDLEDTPFPYRPGQAAAIGLANGDLRVPYSIASAPVESQRGRFLDFLARRDPASRLIHIKRGSRLAVEGPFGSFTFPAKPPERNFLFVAGGIGIAPLRSMIRQAVLLRQPGRLRLLYSARSPDEFAYLLELRQLAREREIELALTATREATSRWHGERGRITPARLAPLIDTPETLCFVCGPSSMVDDVPRMLRDLGVDEKRIRIEEWWEEEGRRMKEER